MSGGTADYCPETDDGVIAAGAGHPLGYQRNLKSTGNPGDVDIFILNTVALQGIQCTAYQLIGNKFVKAGGNDTDAKPLAVIFSLNNVCHNYSSCESSLLTILLSSMGFPLRG